MRFDRNRRLRLQGDFAKVRSSGDVRRSAPFMIRYRDRSTDESSTGLTGPRLGVVASRRIGGAVRRNLAKRRVRALFRECWMDLPLPLDVVVVVRREFFDLSYSELQDQFERLGRRWTNHEN